MEQEKKINELRKQIQQGWKSINGALEEAVDFGFKKASDAAFEFVKSRTPESEREQMTIEFIRAMMLKGGEE